MAFLPSGYARKSSVGNAAPLRGIPSRPLSISFNCSSSVRMKSVSGLGTAKAFSARRSMSYVPCGISYLDITLANRRSRSARISSLRSRVNSGSSVGDAYKPLYGSVGDFSALRACVSSAVCIKSVPGSMPSKFCCICPIAAEPKPKPFLGASSICGNWPKIVGPSSLRLAIRWIPWISGRIFCSYNSACFLRSATSASFLRLTKSGIDSWVSSGNFDSGPKSKPSCSCPLGAGPCSAMTLSRLFCAASTLAYSFLATSGS